MKALRKLLLCLVPLLPLTAMQARAETVYWSDDFETNAASRWTVNGTWHIGAPTAGPAINGAGYRTHSDTNCASTQNYANNVDSRLICTNYNGTNVLQVPPAFQYPRLRFWQWYNLANALGYVEISTNLSINSTNWIQIAPTSLNIGGGGVWSRPSIDLSAYAGQAVLLAFHFTSGGCCGNALGWFVDDVAVVTGQPGLTFPESFESGLGDWSVDRGTWEVGTPTSGPRSAHTGTNCAATVLAGNYANSVDTQLISPPFNVPSNNPSLQFWHWFDFNNALGYVEVSTDSGVSWTQISPTYININSGGLWTNVSLNMSAYAGQTIQTAFHFTSGGSYTAPGWYVDDLSFVAAPVLSVPGTQKIYAGQTLTVTNSATNSFLPNALYRFSLPSVFTTNYWIATNGVLNWTNTGIIHGALIWTNDSVAPGTNIIYVTATDNSSPPYSVTNSFDLVFLPPPPPILTVPGTQVIVPGQTLIVTNSATNTYLPGSTFTYGLAVASTNFWINATNGVLAWTNTAVLPGTNLVYVQVTDNSIPPLSTTNSFAIVVALPPLLEVPATQTLHAGQTLATTLAATNPFLPASVFTYRLPAPSTNYWITPAGVLTWTNTGVRNNALVWTNSSVAPGTNIIYVTVTDNSSPGLSATSNFDLVILPPLPPVLTVPTNQTIYAGQTLIVTNTATNSVLPACSFTFGASGPANLDLSNLATNGVLRWATTVTQPAGTYTNIVTVVDNSVPPLAATNSFLVTVSNPPPPTLNLSVPGTSYIYAGQTLVVTISATNSVLPNDTYSYLLIGPVPGNVDQSNLAANGVLKWTPTAAQASSQYDFSVVATDKQLNSLHASTAFTVFVLPTPSPTLTAALARPGAGGFQFTLDTVPDSTWRIDASTNLVAWRPVFTNMADASGSLQFTDLFATNFLERYYRAVVP